MMNEYWQWMAVTAIGLLLFAVPVHAQESMPLDSTDRIDWPAFLRRADLVWEQLPAQWNEGAFLGNGQLGLMCYATRADNRFDIHLGRLDVTDHRKAPDRKTSRGTPGADVMFDFCRLDIGRMALRPAGTIKDGSLRLDLWNAEMTGRIVTDRGVLTLRIATLRDRMLNVIDVSSTEVDEVGKPLPWRWEFLPGNPMSPRAQVFPDQAAKRSYETNPPPRLESRDGASLCVQSLLAGGDYATAWTEQKSSDGRQSRLLVTTANEVPAVDRSAEVALATLRDAGTLQGDAIFDAHRVWWHDYYRRSFVSVPDARIEQFYWIQLYKFATASRPDAPPIDVMGPTFRVMQWPGLWWNLNVQIAYWIAYTGNRLDEATNLLDEVDRNFDPLLAEFSRGGKFGDFAWVIHNYWLHLRCAGDWSAIEKRWMPKARRVVDAYLKKLETDNAGRLNLQPMESPEFEGFKTYRNSTYNLSMLRWLLTALIEADAHAATRSPDDVARWQQTLDRLVALPVDQNGLMIGSERSFDKSHRHFSHLVALHPLYVLDPDSSTDRDLVVRSVKHWHNIDGGKELAGYSFTGGASLYAALGLGDEARQMLTRFLTGRIGIAQLIGNTVYVESGGRNPTLETPLSGAAAVNDMLLQSWGGKLRVFPAMPADWTDASFARLRGQGGFLVSARRSGGKTLWVRITSEAGEPLHVTVSDWSGTVSTDDATISIKDLGDGEYRIELPKGRSILLWPGKTLVNSPIEALPMEGTIENLFGLKRGRELKQNQSWPDVPIAR
jgi:hypothetical protein